MSEQITLTAKIKLALTDEQKALLNKTRTAYTDALNFISDYIYRTHIKSEKKLNEELYSQVKIRFGLKSQMVQSCIKRVLAGYKAMDTNGLGCKRPAYTKKQLEMVWDRDVAFYKGKLISVNTVNKRIRVPYIIKGYEEFFRDHRYKPGTAHLVPKHGEYYIHVPVSCMVPECNCDHIQRFVGIDRGIRFLVAYYDDNGKCGFVSGKNIRHKRRRYKALRQQLQKKGTKSARRKLKRIGRREYRWIQDANHIISKRLVEMYPENTVFVIEDLSTVRKALEHVKKHDRSVYCSWPYADLEKKLMYKAKRKGSLVIKVDPHYTSQRCPVCGYIDKKNRDKKRHIFCCGKCGYRSNDDRAAAMNIMKLGREKLTQERLVPEDYTVE